jgi:hypothetical protein
MVESTIFHARPDVNAGVMSTVSMTVFQTVRRDSNSRSRTKGGIVDWFEHRIVCRYISYNKSPKWWFRWCDFRRAVDKVWILRPWVDKYTGENRILRYYCKLVGHRIEDRTEQSLDTCTRKIKCLRCSQWTFNWSHSYEHWCKEGQDTVVYYTSKTIPNIH